MISLHETEHIVLVKRRHPVYLVIGLVPIAAAFLAFLALAGYALIAGISIPERVIELFPFLEAVDAGLFVAFVLSLAALLLWQVMLVFAVAFYLDCWIITNERAIHTELHALFSRSTSSISHDKIQDVTVDVHGILPTIFRFGDLQLQTAGAFRVFTMKQIDDPHNAKHVLLQMRRDYLRHHPSGTVPEEGVSSQPSSPDESSGER